MLTAKLVALASTATLSMCMPLPQGDITKAQTWGDYFLDKFRQRYGNN